MNLKGEELRKNRRKRVNLWLSNPHMQNEELRKDQKEHPEKWVDYYIRSKRQNIGTYKSN